MSTCGCPIACVPEALTHDQREASRALREVLSKASTKRIELSTGYAFELRADDDAFRAAAEWVTLERRCCPFLTFELRWAAGDEEGPKLTITGPEGTKAFLAAELPELPTELPLPP